MADALPLLPLLKQYFGFSSFRPLQQEIILDSLAGRDTFALLPTGGGKSLCFQLPALARDGLTVVISPLIALMKDQVDALHAAGAPATFLNSSLNQTEGRDRYRRLHNGEYRLLYVAPERLMLDGMLDALRKWNVRLIAIDEAHCISEWGHDFRPEYRQIANLRPMFPDVPMMALTATATERVRTDIVTQLKLRDPRVYVASFNRPNLTYRVVPKSSGYGQLLEFVRARPREAGIVYCASRAATEKLEERLNADGVKARAYHAGLTPKQRSENQELFLRDEIRVVCATIAFGMGINKPNVRFVVHYDLPKNIEGYYQETGRAGRDGLPSDCLLLFNPGDVVKQMRFIDEKPSPREQQIAREQLQQMVHYAESADCRRAELLAYFGEEFGAPNSDSARSNIKHGRADSEIGAPGCGGCDNCLAPRETFDGTLAAQKILSCVYRIRQHSHFGVGMNHVVEVLTGADTEKVRKWGHHQLSTYNIGREHDRREWQSIGRELTRLGLLSQSNEKFSTLELTDEGMAVLKERKPVTLTRPMKMVKAAHQAGEIACDEMLFERLRGFRKHLADERGVPPYIIFSDVALRQMARSYPANEAEFSRISGVGSQKLREFAALFVGEIAKHLASNARQMFAEESFTSGPPPKPVLTDTVRESLKRFRAGETVEEIARSRQIVSGTVHGHLATAIEAGEGVPLRALMNVEDWECMSGALREHTGAAMTPVHNALNGRYDFGLLRIVRAAMNQGRKFG